jgi:hypothetical protein
MAAVHRKGVVMSFELNQVDLMGMTDDQKRAVLEAMVAAAWADGNVSPAEAARFEQELGRMPLAKDVATLQQWVVAARDEFTKLKTRDAILAHIKDIAGRLPLPHIREKVLYHMGAVAYSGGKEGFLNQNEKNVLMAFTTAFGITKERFDLIGKQVMGK